jgi:hypothetical protein
MTLSDASLLKLIAASEVSNAGTMFLYQPSLSGMVQYFSLITNQSTILLVMVYQPNEQGSVH